MKERLVKELDENNTVVSYKWKSEVQKKIYNKKKTHLAQVSRTRCTTVI